MILSNATARLALEVSPQNLLTEGYIQDKTAMPLHANKFQAHLTGVDGEEGVYCAWFGHSLNEA